MAMRTRCVEGDGMHRLEMKNYKRPYVCYGCEEQGFGLRLRCDQCSYEFHEECTLDFTGPISHEFFPGSEFHFQLTPPKLPSQNHETYCDACRNPVKGFIFHCEKDNLDLHPCCRKLAKSYQLNKDVKFDLSKKVQGKCMKCRHRDGGKKKGWSYVSKCKKYHVHVDCVTQMALDEWNNNNSLTARSSLAVRNSRPTQHRNNGGGSGITWDVVKFIVETIVSTVIGDPTTLVASSIIEAIINI